MTAEFNAVKTQMKNPQTLNVPSPVTVGGDAWLQKAATGLISSGGQDIPGQINIMVAQRRIRASLLVIPRH